MSKDTKPIDHTTLAGLARGARYDLDPARYGIVGPAFEGAAALFDSLDQVELGETPPTNAFDARWRETR